MASKKDSFKKKYKTVAPRDKMPVIIRKPKEGKTIKA